MLTLRANTAPRELYAVPILEATARRLVLDLPEHFIEPVRDMLLRVRKQAWQETRSARAAARIEAGVLHRCQALISDRPDIGIFALEKRIREFALRETQIYNRQLRRSLFGRVRMLISRRAA